MAESPVELLTAVVGNMAEEMPIRVLHVDDDVCFLKSSKTILEIQGLFQVENAASIEEAKEKMRKNEYDAIICDYQMHEQEGLQFLRELRQKGNTLPFVIFTGKGREEVTMKALNLGADGYFDKTGQPETVYGELIHGIHLIVERKKAEEALRKSEEKFRNLFDNANDAMIYLDGSGRILDVNTRTVEVFGGTKEELIGKQFTEIGIFSVKETSELMRNLANILAGNKANLTLTIKNKNAQEIDLECSASLMKSDKSTSIVVVARDISERKKAEQSIVESHQKFAALFSGSPEATIYADPNMHILDVNPRFIELFGYSLEEVKGKHIDDVVVPKSLVEEGKMLGEKAAKELVYHDTFRKKKDGSLVPVSVSAAPISIQGHLAGYLATYKDISELKRTEKELKETLRRLELMNEKLLVVGGLTRHDARNKLTAIVGNTYLVKKNVPEDSAVSMYLEEIETSVKQTTAIFEFAKTYESLGVEDLKYIDVEKVIDEAVALIPDPKGVRIINQCDGLAVLADSLLRQLFYNLIDNSLKYGEKISQIKISFEETNENQLKLVCEDDGVGIQFDAKPKLFSRGYTTGKGSGYGLYLIKKMIEVYGWTIEEKGKPGEGARFIIKIPKTSENGKSGYELR
jgi:PAS domain S-box-containing protein